jgi:urea transport system ATP-binding protein
MLSVEGVDAGYGRTQVLFGISVEVPDDGLVCCMGRNGVGKTTLLHTIMGVIRPDRGRVVLDGRDITRLRSYDRVRAGLAYVPQGRDGFPQLTVGENLTVVAEAAGRRARGAVDDALDFFPRLKPILGRRAGFLSGGQQQQLAIARALAAGPKLLILDEPTEGIQPSIIKDIGRAISYLRSLGNIAIVLVEQYLDFACELGDQFAVMDRGAVKYSCDRSNLDSGEISRAMAL